MTLQEFEALKPGDIVEYFLYDHKATVIEPFTKQPDSNSYVMIRETSGAITCIFDYEISAWDVLKKKESV